MGQRNSPQFPLYIPSKSRWDSRLTVKALDSMGVPYRVVWKFNRWHHHVDYTPFRRNKLIRRTDIEVPDGVDDYGMRLRKIK